MVRLETLISIAKRPRRIIRPLGVRGLFNWLPDKPYLKLLYWAATGKNLNLEDPRRFNEKLQWIKLYDRRPEYTLYADKYAVRSFIKERIGEKYLIPLLGIYDDVESIEWDKLPPSFVIKTTHSCGTNIICPDKTTLDIEQAKKKINKWMNKNAFWGLREWPYKNIKPKIVCEKFISDTNNTPDDYKVLTFNGKAKLIEYHVDRYGDHRQDFYNLKWERVDISQGHMPNTKYLKEKPKPLEEMIGLSEILATGISHIRVDWYIVKEKLYFGEMTFFDGSGLAPFDNDNDDYLLGSWITLPLEKTKDEKLLL